ncbi:hypothetical protein AGLY_004897 [Aphis glycines]|uniref:Uncharacterized protein n=1 Tax=Aphis glycines TaxID=307491 RepID=A0A6G0TV62_APHGL|nr:hypothetical protein AGLY_004897 [Aphis glycines]
MVSEFGGPVVLGEIEINANIVLKLNRISDIVSMDSMGGKSKLNSSFQSFTNRNPLCFVFTRYIRQFNTRLIILALIQNTLKFLQYLPYKKSYLAEPMHLIWLPLIKGNNSHSNQYIRPDQGILSPLESSRNYSYTMTKTSHLNFDILKDFYTQQDLVRSTDGLTKPGVVYRQQDLCIAVRWHGHLTRCLLDDTSKNDLTKLSCQPNQIILCVASLTNVAV